MVLCSVKNLDNLTILNFDCGKNRGTRSQSLANGSIGQAQSLKIDARGLEKSVPLLSQKSSNLRVRVSVPDLNSNSANIVVSTDFHPNRRNILVVL